MADLRARIRYAKEYPFNYHGHLDTVKELERAMRRSAWPFSITEGYNPRIKMSSLPPLSLGFFSRAEYLEVSLKSRVREYQLNNFKNSLPAGIEIISVEIIPPGAPEINDILKGYRYKIEFNFAVPEAPSEGLQIKKRGENFLLVDIFKKNGNIRNPAKFIDRKYFKKVTKIKCIFYGAESMKGDSIC